MGLAHSVITMRILVNMSNLKKGGALQVASSVINELLSDSLGHEIKIIISIQAASVIPHVTDTRIIRLDNGLGTGIVSDRLKLGKIEREFQPDVVFTLFGPTYWRPHSIHVSGFANSWLFARNEFAQSVLNVRSRLVARVGRLLRLLCLRWENPVAMVVETASLAEAIQSAWPWKRVYVVPNTCSQVFFEAREKRKRRKGAILSIPRHGSVVNVATLSSYYPHKNLELIPFVAKVLKEIQSNFFFKFHLSIELNSEAWKTISAISASLGVKDNVVSKGRIAPKLAPQFYEEADIMFLPSLLETFSASYPEAMIMEVPIVTSDLPFAKSVCGNAALYFEPMNAFSAASKIVELCYNPKMVERLVREGIRVVDQLPTPRERAEAYLRICEEVVKRKEIWNTHMKRRIYRT